MYVRLSSLTLLPRKIQGVRLESLTYEEAATVALDNYKKSNWL